MSINTLLGKSTILLKVGTKTYSYTPAQTQSAYSLLDKVSTGGDAVVLFRDGGAIKGAIGATGDDNVHLRVATGSAGSETFTDALVLENSTGDVYIPVALGVGTSGPTNPIHISATQASSRVSMKIENTAIGGSSGAQIEFKGDSPSVDWIVGTDYGQAGVNDIFIQDIVGGLRLFIDWNGRVVLGDYSASTAVNNSFETLGSIKTRGTNYSLSALNFVGRLTTTGSPASGTYAVGDAILDASGNWYFCSTAGTPGTWTGAGSGAVNGLAFGLNRNYKTSAGGAITTGTAAFSDTSNTFTSADVGKYITIVGAGTSGADLSTTISAFVSSTAVTLAANAATTVSGATYGYGTDDSTAINNAITAASTLGGTVVLPPGNYALGASITPANNVRLEGSGWGATVLYPFGTVAGVNKIATSGSPLTSFYLGKLCIDGARQVGPYTTGIKGIYIQYMSQCTIQDVLARNCVATGIGTDFLTNGTKIDNCIALNNGRLNVGGGSGGGGNGIGIGVGQHTVEDFVVTNCFSSGNGRYGFLIESQTGTTSRGMRFVSCYSVSNSNSGFGDAGGSGCQFIGCISAQNSLDGFTVDNGTIGATAQPGGNTMFTGCEAIANTRFGFTYNPTATNSTNASGAGNISWVGCKSWNNTSLGWYINPISGHAVSGLYLSGCDATGNGTSGLEIANTCSDVVITGSKFRSNGQNSGTNNFGVYIATGTVTNFQMNGCRVWDDGGTQKQAYAIDLASGTTISTGTITNNDFRGNMTGVLNNAGTLTSVVLEKNPGGPVSVTYSATQATDCSTGDEFEVTLTGAVTLSNPTNMVDGQTIRWRFTQDGTGGRVLTLGSAFNGVFTLSTAANAVDYLQATYNAATTNWDIANQRSSLVDFGTGAPGTITGQKVGDVYIDLNTGNFYQYS